MNFEYFLTLNKDNIYIEDRESVLNRYVVWANDSCVADCLNKTKALALANQCLKEKQQGK